MIYKINIYSRKCPYCGKDLNKEYYAPEIWGMKYGRCPYCKTIFSTGKRLYSDVSPEERKKEKKDTINMGLILTSLFIISVLTTIFTGWELMGVFAFLLFISSICAIASYLSKSKETLDKYRYLKEKDPELYKLEYEESMKILEKYK